MVNALDFTSKGDDQDVEVLIDGSQKIMIKKKLLTDVLVENVELNEYGVYNSENDINNNVKTKENEPSNTESFIHSLIDSTKTIVGTLAGVKETIEENSKLSFESINICIAELQTYIKSLEDEANNIGSATT